MDSEKLLHPGSSSDPYDITISDCKIIEEINDNNETVASYFLPGSGAALKRSSRGFSVSALPRKVLDAFLPVGYPNSVSPDYLDYQIYDSLQAFSSSMAGLLSSRAVLQGFGVGDANASATNALLLSILQESVGRIATILFAFRFGVALEHECKRYRLLADFFNDGALILDCASPVLPRYARVVCLCLSGSLRALCGCAAGGAKATLSMHFAKYGNVGDLSAKDASQETIISLAGMLAGSFLVSSITSSFATWTTLFALLFLHLWTNYKAVSAVRMRTLSRQRATIVISEFLDNNNVLDPHAVSQKEQIFARGNKIRDINGNLVGYARIGVRIGETDVFSIEQKRLFFKDLTGVFANEKYILWPSNLESHKPDICIFLKEGASSMDKLKAWAHAIILLKEFSQSKDSSSGTEAERYKGLTKDVSVIRTDHVEKSLINVNGVWKVLVREFADAGWETEISALVAGPSHTMRISDDKKTL